MLEVGVSRRFQARHRLQLHDGSLHEDGHSYRVEVVVRGDRIGEAGMLLDLDVLASAVGDCVTRLDGADLDALPAFSGRPTTVEVVAGEVWRQVAERLPGSASLRELRVTLFEADDAWAAVDGVLAERARA